MIPKIIFSIGLFCVLVCFGSILYVLFNIHLNKHLFKIVFYNLNFWLLFSVAFSYAIWRKYKNSIEINWIEFCSQIVLSFVVLVGLSSVFLLSTAGLYDTEVWNGFVKNASYYEEWTERVTYTEESCTGSGENRQCVTVTKVRFDYHPPYWELTTSNDEVVKISSQNYANFVKAFGNERKFYLSRINQVSIGDGDKFQVIWNGQYESIVPSAVEHTYINYLKASKSLKKHSGVSQEFEKLILPYPQVYSTKFGKIEIDRVLLSNVSVPSAWVKEVDSQIDRFLSVIGKEKEVNCLIYLVNSSDRSFLHALEQKWYFGKKNDLVLVLGVTQFPSVEWAGVMVFHGNHDLKVKLRDAIETANDISNPKEFATLVASYIQSDFTRVKMSELEHLIYDIELPWWAVLIVILFFGVTVCFVSLYFENNQFRSKRGK